MKRGLLLTMIVMMLCGCGGENAQLRRVDSLRERLLRMESCSFRAVICADFGDVTYEFAVSCRGDKEGNLSFTVEEPEAIAGISGSVHSQGGQLIFDDSVLGFPLLADGEVSPVSAPWLLLRTLLGGYISSAVSEEPYLHVTMDDSYEADALRLDIWLDQQDLPHHAEIVWQGRRVLSIQVDSFSIV